MHKRLWFALVALLGCGDDDQGGGDTRSTAAATCAQGCARAAGARCPSQPLDCQQRCEDAIARTPASCLNAVGAYADCLTTAVFSCDSTGAAEATGCAAELATWVVCTGGIPDAGQPTGVTDAGQPGLPDTGTPSVPDTGVPDTGVPDAGPSGLSCVPLATDVQCDVCLKRSCCETLSACTGDCVSLLNCFNQCDPNDQSCGDNCGQLYSGGIPGVQLIYQCMAGPCAVDCEDEL